MNRLFVFLILFMTTSYVFAENAKIACEGITGVQVRYGQCWPGEKLVGVMSSVPQRQSSTYFNDSYQAKIACEGITGVQVRTGQCYPGERLVRVME